MSYGRTKIMGCGHVGEAIVGQFYLCSQSKWCDGKPRCRKCGSAKVTPFVSDQVPAGSLHCWLCGAVWWAGT